MFLRSLAAALLLAAPAWAQDAPPQIDAAQAVIADWDMNQTAQRHLADSLTRLTNERGALKKQLEAERRWWAGYLKGLEQPNADR